jgi:hypothetical protein
MIDYNLIHYLRYLESQGLSARERKESIRILDHEVLKEVVRTYTREHLRRDLGENLKVTAALTGLSAAVSIGTIVNDDVSLAARVVITALALPFAMVPLVKVAKTAYAYVRT